MAPKKRRKKAADPDSGENTQQGKITLPAFGLAEDILGASAPAAAPDNGGAQLRKQAPLPAFGRAEDVLGAAGPGAAGAAVPRPDAAADGTGHLTLQGGDNGDKGDELHLVTFRIAQEEYAVEIGRVQEIIRVGTITTVPNSQVFIQGVINLRGRVIPVLNLRKRLQLPDSPLTKHSRIMIVETGAKVLGMLVDGVSQVMRIPSAVIDAPPGDGDQKTSFVSGIGRVDSRLILLMDLERVLAREAHKAGTA